LWEAYPNLQRRTFVKSAGFDAGFGKGYSIVDYPDQNQITTNHQAYYSYYAAFDISTIDKFTHSN
jgi:hypothetical protein